MTAAPPWQKLSRLADHESLQPDLGRGIRATVAFMVPLLLAAAGRLPLSVTYVALAAQNIAMVDVRGSYALRFGLLLAMTAILAASAGLGSLAGNGLLTAMLAMGCIAASGGLWRHLSSDYGMSLAISSTLIFLLALSAPEGAAATGAHVTAVLAGGLWGLLLQVVNWPFRPQHPLRRAVADSWLAVADLFEAMAPSAATDTARRHEQVNAAEAALRTTLDRAYATLAAATRAGPLLRRLEDLNLAAARLVTRVVAFNTALETLMTQPGFATLAPSFQTVLTALKNTSRTVALAVVSRQPAQLATADVRLRRLTNHLRVLRARVMAQADGNPAGAQLAEILRQIEEHLPAIGEALRITIDRADERAAFSLELLDVQTWTLRPLASALNLHRQVDPALVRFTGRIAVLTIFGVVVLKLLNLPHGYWLPFTMVVVLQPDYGSTRQRAGQRVFGTLTGSLVASLLLWLHPPFAVVMIAMAATIFIFSFLVKRNYGLAVFFITLFVVLLTEANGPVTIAFTAERLASTLSGGALAMLAAMFFWPVWEKERLPPLLTQALRANRDYLQLLTARLLAGGTYDQAVIDTRRRTERANSTVFSSLQRMIGDPKNKQDGLEQVAALANGNQRLTRALTVITLHLTAGTPSNQPEIERFGQLAGEALDTLAASVEKTEVDHRQLESLLSALDNFQFPSAGSAPTEVETQRDQWVFGQFTQCATELGAMILAAQGLAAV